MKRHHTHTQFKWQHFGQLLTFLSSFFSFPHSSSIFKKLFSRSSSISKYFITPLLCVRTGECSSFNETRFTSGMNSPLTLEELEQMSDKRAISESYFMPGTNVECFWDFQYTDQSFIVSHSQEVLPGCWKKTKRFGV